MNTQVTSALATQVSLQIAGSLGNTQLTFAAGTKLSALAAAVQNVSSYTGVSATASGSTLTFNTTGSGSNQFVSVVTTQGSFNVTPNSKGEAIEQTVADGFSNIESALSYPTVNLTDAQYAKLDADFAQLRAQQTQFQNTVARRTTPNYASLTKQLSSKVNAYEHQVTWQIDNGQPVTGPSDTSKPSTDSKLSQTITSGFGALIADTSKALGTLSPGLATQFGKFKDSLADEQARFIKFAVDRQQKKSA